MLADSTEAAVRASQDRSQERIDALVESIIQERMAEGQFDECDITLRDLRVIAESFKSSLRAIYHPRIEYPAPIETRGAASPATPNGTTSAAEPPVPASPAGDMDPVAVSEPILQTDESDERAPEPAATQEEAPKPPLPART
jgi:hypothetical protein